MPQLLNQAVREDGGPSGDVDRGGVAVASPDCEFRDEDAPAAVSDGPSLLKRILPGRVWALAGILAVECLAFAQLQRPWLAGTSLMPVPIAFGIALLLFGRSELLRYACQQAAAISKKLIALHIFAVAVMAISNVALADSWVTSPGAMWASICIWTVALPAVVLTLVAALFPVRDWLGLVRNLRAAWIYAALTTLLAVTARDRLRVAWNVHSKVGSDLQWAAFVGVKTVLGLFYANVLSFPAEQIVGTPRFAVNIEGGCSGIEGVALMLALTVIWLFHLRAELRLSRAIWLVPVSLAAIWLLNIVRIAALIAIGDAGHPDIATKGFHTEAGWVFFNVIAIGFLLAAQHVAWLRKDVPAAKAVATQLSRHSAEAVYLLPFLAIIAASLVSQLFSNGFEWLYPLRFAAALGVLWYFRDEYRRIDWGFAWRGPLAGVAVFALWFWLSKLTGGNAAADTLWAHLARLPLWQRAGWLAVRCTAMVVTVPIAEELAFRGYAARRVMSSDVDAVSYAQLSPLAIAISAVIFGLLHGQMWIAGIVAGAVFALVAKWSGRLGEALAAHATVNLLIAVWGLATGDTSMW